MGSWISRRSTIKKKLRFMSEISLITCKPWSKGSTETFVRPSSSFHNWRTTADWQTRSTILGARLWIPSTKGIYCKQKPTESSFDYVPEFKWRNNVTSTRAYWQTKWKVNLQQYPAYERLPIKSDVLLQLESSSWCRICRSQSWQASKAANYAWIQNKVQC